MNFTGNTPDDHIDINVTSLIDVVLLLLIFFMVSTTFLNPSHINLTLPKASNSSTEREKPRTIEVSVDKEGRYAVNGQMLVNSQPATLKRALGEAAQGAADRRSGRRAGHPSKRHPCPRRGQPAGAGAHLLRHGNPAGSGRTLIA